MLLAKSSFAQTSYSIIGQGMIDSFLLASPAERKEFFEEASGVKPLQLKREQCLNKLCLTEENLTTAKIQLQEIEPRLNSLTRQVKKLEKRADLEQTLRKTQEKYYGALWQEIAEEFEKILNDLKQASDQQQKKKETADHWQNELSKLTREASQTAVLEKLQNDYQTSLTQKMHLQEELSNTKIKLLQLHVSQEKKQDRLPLAVGEEMKKSLRVLKTWQEKMSAALAVKDYSALEKALTAIAETIAQLETTLNPFFRPVNSLDAALAEKNKQAELEAKIKTSQEKIEEIQNQIKAEHLKEKAERSQIWEIQQQYQTAQEEFNRAANETNNLRVLSARLETRRDDLVHEVAEEMAGADWLSQGQKEKITAEEKTVLHEEIQRFKHQLELIGGIDPEVQQEYGETKNRFDFLSEQIKDLTHSLKSLEGLIKELDGNIRQQFEHNFKIIDAEFQTYFKMLFAGGKARLILLKKQNLPEETVAPDLATSPNSIPSLSAEKTEEEKIRARLEVDLYEGIDIEATPPGKKLKSISMLSGGERALTSIALLCAIITANPSPFIVLDEVDAALDEANSLRLADILEKLARRSQLIVITHNRATMEKADILYGVTMGDDGISKLLSLHLESATKYTNR
jgi:chromosome segregation protein